MEVSGSCSVDKLSGMVYVREDVTPSKLEWKAIDVQKTLSIPLNLLVNLQATKDGSPKMILKVIYRPQGEKEDKAIKLTFTNRPTMNNIKDALQAIVARQRTVIKDLPLAATPTPGSSTPGPGTPKGAVTGLDCFNNPDALLDANLLKNLQLQQKLLLEDRNLRNIFTQSVMNFKLLPTVFWSTRINQLRTYALTISQHKGPYNILSTIKPVASSDNQVNVNVTRDMINEIFETYPIVKRAFDDLVPAKFSEGELWSRFFNSKLFRRLRGDKVNVQTDRGDVILDKYLALDQNALNENLHVNKFIDLQGNEENNSQRLGNQPDMTMRFEEPAPGDKEGNEMIVLMRNMNKLLSKMVSMSERQLDQHAAKRHKSADENEYTPELELNDLNEAEELKYIRLNIDTNIDGGRELSVAPADPVPDVAAVADLFTRSRFTSKDTDLCDIYALRKADIEKTATEMNVFVKQNYKTYRLITSTSDPGTKNIVPHALIQEIVRYNMTVVEFLSHFWKLFLTGSNLVQLKKIFTSLKTYQSDIAAFKERSIASFSDIEELRDNEKMLDRFKKDFNNCLLPIERALDKACGEYVDAVRHQRGENANGKRPLEE